MCWKVPGKLHTTGSSKERRAAQQSQWSELDPPPLETQCSVTKNFFWLDTCIAETVRNRMTEEGECFWALCSLVALELSSPASRSDGTNFTLAKRAPALLARCCELLQGAFTRFNCSCKCSHPYSVASPGWSSWDMITFYQGLKNLGAVLLVRTTA